MRRHVNAKLSVQDIYPFTSATSVAFQEGNKPLSGLIICDHNGFPSASSLVISILVLPSAFAKSVEPTAIILLSLFSLARLKSSQLPPLLAPIFFDQITFPLFSNLAINASGFSYLHLRIRALPQTIYLLSKVPVIERNGAKAL